MDSSSPQFMLLQALQCACSQDTVMLKMAEQKLGEWEIEPGFYTMLMQIVSNHSIDSGVRWMAAVCLKNGVSKYWRKNAPNEISAEEKLTIKTALLGSFNEPVPEISVQLAVVVSKIARLDCPRDWAEVVPTLLEAVRTNEGLQQQRALLVLRHVVKALSSKRLMADKRNFEQLTATLYSFVLNLWDGFTTLYFQSVRENAAPELSMEYLDKGLLTLQILRKLTIHGFSKPFKSEDCMMFIKVIFGRLKESLEIRLQVKSNSAVLLEKTEKFILKQMKILNEFLDQHPYSFIECIPTALEFAFNYVFDEGTNMIYEGNVISFTNFAIHCINLMKGIVSSRVYDMYLEKEQSQEFFTQERISYICEKIIMHYFLLTQIDLELWDDDPESFSSDEGGESWKYDLRPCTETFFLSLFNKFRHRFTPEMLKYIRKAQAITLDSTSDLKDVMIKDSIYNAAGLSAFNLFDEVDFDQWFTEQLIHELKIKSNNFRIIRRRVIWLIGQWTGVKLSRNLRPQVYSACLDLLQRKEDMSVRLAASKALMSTMDDFEFEAESFLQFLEPSFEMLYLLLKEVKECNTKINVLNIMSFIVSKMSDNIHAHTDNLIQYLPHLWEESQDHNMLRCAIISILHQIVHSIGDIPNHLAPFLYPVIALSTNVNDPSHIYMLEEGLELWLIVVKNSATLTSELLELCANILPIIKNSSENLRISLLIIQAYVFLNPVIYLDRYGKDVVSTCAYLMTDLRIEGCVMIMRLFDACLRARPAFSTELLKPVLSDIFRKVYEDKDFPMMMTMYLTIVSRIMIINQTIFSQTLQEMNVEKPLEQILDVFILKMPLVTETARKKLLCLALSSLLTVQSNIVFERFSLIITCISETLNDVMDDMAGAAGSTDILLYNELNDFNTNTPWNFKDYEYMTYERCRELCLNDPVHTVNLSEYFQTQLVTLKNQLGEERYQNLCSTLDTEIVANLSGFIKLKW